MNINKIFFSKALLTAILVASPFINYADAKNISIYRWVDKDNIVHFSQSLPQGQDYTELSTVSSFKALSKAERKALAADGQITKTAENRADQEQSRLDKNRTTMEKNCKAARLNIQMLNSLNDIVISETKSDGTIGNRSLTDEEKVVKLEQSKKQVELFCKG